MSLKTCTKCNKTKLEKYYYKTGVGTLKSWCKECDKRLRVERNKNQKATIKKEKVLTASQVYGEQERLRKSKVQTDKVKCRCCTSYNERSDMYDKDVCRWCKENIRDYKTKLKPRDLTNKKERSKI